MEEGQWTRQYKSVWNGIRTCGQHVCRKILWRAVGLGYLLKLLNKGFVDAQWIGDELLQNASKLIHTLRMPLSTVKRQIDIKPLIQHSIFLHSCRCKRERHDIKFGIKESGAQHAKVPHPVLNI